MRLPFIQVTMEVIEQYAPELAVELNAREADIGWGLIRLFPWALGRCPDDAPPSHHDVVEGPFAAKLIARACSYRGDAEAFVTACERVGLLQRVPGGIRVRGLDRYDEAWLNAKSRAATRSAKAKHAADVRWGMLRDSQASSEHTAEHSPSTNQALAEHQNTMLPDALDPDPDPYPDKNHHHPQTPASKSAVVVAVGQLTVGQDVYAASEDDCWRLLQASREANGLKREGARPRGFGAWFLAAVRECGLDGIFYAYRDFVVDPGIRSKATAVFLRCWDVRKPPPISQPITAAST